MGKREEGTLRVKKKFYTRFLFTTYFEVVLNLNFPYSVHEKKKKTEKTERKSYVPITDLEVVGGTWHVLEFLLSVHVVLVFFLTVDSWKISTKRSEPYEGRSAVNKNKN